MTTALEISKFFIELGNTIAEKEQGDAITNLRLNKLLYYAQAYSLVRLGHPLFDDRIEAWDKGPVVPTVYRNYRKNGSNVLTDKPFNRDNVDSDEFDLLFDVFRNTESMSTTELVNKTHEDGSPWKKVYVKDQNNEIPTDSIKEYFSDKVPPRRKLNPRIKIYNPLYRDENGVPVFPKEAFYG